VLRRAFGRFVFVVVIALGLYFVVSHYRDGSGWMRCRQQRHRSRRCRAPRDCRSGAADRSWAQKPQRATRSEYLTTGRYFTDKDATVRTLTSGWDAAVSDRAADILRDSPNFPNMPKTAKPTVAGDVETKLAEMMRESGATSGVVAINHPKMCDGAMGCTIAVAAILPVGSVLHVWELDATTVLTISGKGAA
jgi:hypothetical protein